MAKRKHYCPTCGHSLTKTKHKVMKLLRHGRILSVNEITAKVKAKQPLVSHTLKQLGKSGRLSVKRHGTFKLYRIKVKR